MIGTDTDVAAVRDLLRRLCTWSGLSPDRLGATAIDPRALYSLKVVTDEAARSGLELPDAAVRVIGDLARRLPATARLITDAELVLGLFRDTEPEGIDLELLYAPSLGTRRQTLVANWRALHEALGSRSVPAAPTTRSLRARPEVEAFTSLAALLVSASVEVPEPVVTGKPIRGGGIGSVVVVGEAVIDRILRVRQIPAVGTSASARSLQHPGGKGFKRAICAAHLGLDVQLIAIVGSDAASREIVEYLHEQNVGTALVKVVAEAPAPETLVVVEDDGRAIYFPIEERVRLAAEDLREPARWAALTTSDAMLVTFEHPVDVIVEALRAAKAARQAGGGPLVILHPSPPVRSAQHLRDLLAVIDTVDYIIGTTRELRLMLPDSPGAADQDIIAERLHGLRIGTVCLIENYRCVVRAGNVRTSISAARAAALDDSPGARSAFVAALAYRLALVHGPAVPEDFRWATAAMIATQNYLESPGAMPTVDDIDRVLHLAVEEF